MSDTSGTDPSAPDWIENEKVREILQEHLDETDYAIYRELNTHGRISDTELGERVGLSRTAARRRRKKLIEEGTIDILAVMVLQRAELAYADVRLRFDTTATNEEVTEFIDEIIQEELIYEIDEYMGDHDLLVRTWHATLSDIKEYVRTKFQGNGLVSEYEIAPVTKTYKAWHKPLTNGTASPED